MGIKSNNGVKTADVGGKVFRILLVILSVILVVMVIIAVNVIRRESYVYISEPDDLLREIKNGYYSDAVIDMNDNIAKGETAEKDPDYSAPYAILEYYEAASLYNGYKGVGMSSDQARNAVITEAAERCKTEMENARGRMGELEFFASEIDDIFMLNES